MEGVDTRISSQFREAHTQKLLFVLELDNIIPNFTRPNTIQSEIILTINPSSQ